MTPMGVLGGAGTPGGGCSTHKWSSVGLTAPMGGLGVLGHLGGGLGGPTAPMGGPTAAVGLHTEWGYSRRGAEPTAHPPHF